MARSQKSGYMAKQALSAKYALGPEEVAHRDKVAHQPGGKPFSQIGHKSPSGTANEPPRVVKSGDFKFSRGV